MEKLEIMIQGLFISSFLRSSNDTAVLSIASRENAKQYDYSSNSKSDDGNRL